MKKNILRIFLITLVFSFGCSDDFLTRSYEDRPGEDNFLTNISSAKQLVVASYRPWIDASNMYRKEILMLMDTLTDDGYIRLNGSTRIQITNWSFLPNLGLMGEWYTNPYQSINAANYAIKQIPNLAAEREDVTKEDIQPYIAEARFMRGFSYLFLVHFFGEVPLITEPLSSIEEYSQPRATVESIYDQIISDFSFAKENLLEDDGDYEGTPTKATAAAFLAKTYLYKKDFANAEDAARDAISTAEATGYHLVDDYPSIFDLNNEGNPELLFYFSYVRNDADYGQLMSVERNIRDLPGELRHIQGGEGWGYALATRDLYDAFEDGDPRRGYTLYSPGDDYGIYNRTEPFTYEHQHYNEEGVLVSNEVTYEAGDIVKYDMQWSPSGINVKKLTENLEGLTNVRYAGLDVPVMRMADLYLILAEALAEQGDPEALEWVNKVRARPSVDMPPKTVSDGTLVDIVRHERRVELAMEGQRIWDLMRWNNVKEVFGNGSKVKLHYFSDYLEDNNSNRFKDPTSGLSKYPSDNILFPIPQFEVDQNSEITTNNPGY